MIGAEKSTLGDFEALATLEEQLEAQKASNKKPAQKEAKKDKKQIK